MTSIAIDILRQLQEDCRLRLGISASLKTEQAILEETLKQAEIRQSQTKRVGEYIRSGIFKYPSLTEELRWQRTRDVIRRVKPGIGEDPVFLEILARQAASIEIIIRQEHISPNQKASTLCDHILLGTTVELKPTAFSQPVGDDFLVMLSYGLLSFLYQAAKSVVMSWRPVQAKPGSSISLSPALEDIEYILKGNPHSLDLFYKTLYEYLINGQPRVADYDPPPAEYVPAAELLINYSERFVIAHEYSHALTHQQIGFDALPSKHKAWQQEYAADYSAFFLTIESARVLDLLPPNVALQGGLFALSVHELIRQAYDIVSFGIVHKDDGDGGHPPIQERMAFLKDRYIEYINADGSNSPKINLGIDGALPPSRTLQFLWKRCQNRFLEANRQGRKPHAIWDGIFAAPDVANDAPCQ